MIIDTHMHIGGDLLGFSMKEEDLILSMEKYHIDMGIVSNIDGAEFDKSLNPIPSFLQTNQEDCLKRMIRFARNHLDKIRIAVWIKPYGEKITPAFEKLIQDNLDIICAIKLHPYHSKISPTDERMKPYYDLARKFHLPVVSHTGGCEEASCKNLFLAAKANPDINFVMVHMGLGTDNEEAIQLIKELDNLYGDTTWVALNSTIKAIHTLGKDKMMFGSDAIIDGVDTYYCNPKKERSLYQDYFEFLSKKITKQEYDALMYQNAQKLFKLK